MDSTSGRILEACHERRIVPVLSRVLLREYNQILGHPSLIRRFPNLIGSDVAASLERLRFVADTYSRVPARFVYFRDPKDSPLLELAIVGRATHLVTMDKDLLSLPIGHDDAARRLRHRLPHLEIMPPREFVELI